MRYGIIDLGTNTFKLLVAFVDEKGGIQRIYTDEIGVKLGEGGIGEKYITEEAAERGLKVLEQIQEMWIKHEVDHVEIVATSGIRSASNGKWFISRVKDKFNHEIKVISGEEEAEMIYRGVRQAVQMPDQPVLIVDIGGGSNEFILADKQRYYWKKSYDLGIARILEKFKPSDPIKPDEIDRVNNYFEEELSSLFHSLKNYTVDTILGCAGTFETYRSIIEAENNNTDLRPNREPSFEIKIEEFYRLYDKIVYSSYDERCKVPGLKLFRVEMIVLATIFVNFIVQKFNINRIIQADYAVKEGVLDKIINQ